VDLGRGPDVCPFVQRLLVFFADGLHNTAPPTPSLGESVPGLIATVLCLTAFAIALRRGSGPYGRGPR
jgi:hypothetical protein